MGVLVRRAFRDFLTRNGLPFDEEKALTHSTFFVYGSEEDQMLVRRAINEFWEVP